MEISILTTTYNRAKYLTKLYNSIIENKRISDLQCKWLIMDDGSEDETKEVIDQFIKENKMIIQYYKQENQGKMNAMNNLIANVTSEYIVECDSDDYFTKGAFEIIKEQIEKYKEKQGIYAHVFHKEKTNGEAMGNQFPNEDTETTMFDLYYKKGKTGETVLVFNTEIRKQYRHEVEKDEKFVTESRLYHQIDQKYKVICKNEAVQIASYEEDGYTNNMAKLLIQNPYGFYEYFKEILQMNMKKVQFKKRIYVLKHYILFSIMIEKEKPYREIRGCFNKMIYILLCIPGKMLSKRYIERNNTK